MVRYCKICGQKSGRCNHLVFDLDESEKPDSKNKDGAGSTEDQK